MKWIAHPSLLCMYRMYILMGADKISFVIFRKNLVALSGKKKAISFRIDTGLLAWLKKESSLGYQTFLHEILQQHMQARIAGSERIAGRAQEIFRQYHAQCFWHYDPELVITPENTHLVIEGLKKHGGRRGFLLAEELCL